MTRDTAFYRDWLGMTYLFSAPPGLANLLAAMSEKLREPGA
jgi:hypothetical protein